MKRTTLLLFISMAGILCFGQDPAILKKLNGLDDYMAANLKAWNMPGVGVGIVKNGKLVFVKGYGYRDYEKKLPITANTLFQIASNTKLFTSTGIGLLVNQGKLDWDKPIKTFVPSIQFFNNELNNTITIHDMLSHRTGVSRHDLIWYKSDYNRTELFAKLKYLEPSQSLRQGFLYNNLMYAASGHIIELLEDDTWENFTKKHLLEPLEMSHTVFSIGDMKKQEDYFVPFNEKRDTNILYKIPWLEETEGLGPAGAIISNINDLSHWLSALMNKGIYNSKQVIPEAVVNATIEPSIALHNSNLDLGYTEIVNPVYGMGRESISYRGHPLVMHGGDLNGIHSQISFMPQDSIGVIVFVIGDRNLSYNSISYNIYERLLGLSLTPWSERGLKSRTANRKIDREGRKKVNVGQIAGTKPSHAMTDYLGDYENESYGIINISAKDSLMQFALHKIHLPLKHYHYDRFDTPNDEEDGLYSLNFQTNPQGEIDRFVISLDEGETVFIKKTDASLSNPETLALYAGTYQVGNSKLKIIIKNKNHLFLENEPDIELIPYKPRIFKIKEFSNMTIEFIMANGKVKSMKQKDSSGEYEINRAEQQ
jgi:CubicO group peptidase (beta-lactamase class C family)